MAGTGIVRNAQGSATARPFVSRAGILCGQNNQELAATKTT
jgi:hypothetical protein